jgi:hypothetical protein
MSEDAPRPKPKPVHQGSSVVNRDNVSEDAPRPKPRYKQDLPPSDSDKPLESYDRDISLDNMLGRQRDEYPVDESGIADISVTMSLVAIQDHADNGYSQVSDLCIVVRLTNTICRVVELRNQTILTLEGSSRTETRRATIY